MTVVGIYTTTSSSTESSIQYMNTMYTALSVANSIKGTTGKVSNATYSMENPAQADTFVKAANKLMVFDLRFCLHLLLELLACCLCLPLSALFLVLKVVVQRHFLLHFQQLIESWRIKTQNYWPIFL